MGHCTVLLSTCASLSVNSSEASLCPARQTLRFAQGDTGIRMGHSTVMLSAAKHLSTQRDRPFASLRVTVGDSGGADFIIQIIF